VKLDAVLYPTDFSEASGLAGGVARDLARESGATLHVVHVVPPVTDPADSAERLAETGKRLADGTPVETALLSGRVAREIVRYAREHGVGLIVLATHGRTGLSHAILGSVAEAVVRLAPCWCSRCRRNGRPASRPPSRGRRLRRIIASRAPRKPTISCATRAGPASGLKPSSARSRRSTRAVAARRSEPASAGGVR
jgi:nucleotide-binding universal stress UspA family protein